MSADIAATLTLVDEALQDVRSTLAARIRAGLSADGQQIAALPSFLPPPPLGLAGRALVVDTGGTNTRAALIELRADGEHEILAGPVGRPLPVRGKNRLDAMTFFRIQASLAAELDAPAGLPVGYCFSYGSTSTRDRDARLMHWTKGVEVDGVQGELVGAALGEALRDAGLQPGRVAVLNDTVASLLGGSLDVTLTGPEGALGLIVGTGTNIAAFFDTEACDKLRRNAPPGWMAVNLESGNFAPPHLTAADEALALETEPSGRQRFEKAVSGHYLPQLLARLVPAAGMDPAASCARLVHLRDAPEAGASLLASQVATALLARSADLVAAALCGVLDARGDNQPAAIVAEGSLFWGDPRYGPRVTRTLTRLRGDDRVQIVRRDHANLFGAAVAALCP